MSGQALVVSSTFWLELDANIGGKAHKRESGRFSSICYPLLSFLSFLSLCCEEERTCTHSEKDSYCESIGWKKGPSLRPTLHDETLEQKWNFFKENLIFLSWSSFLRGARERNFFPSLSLSLYPSSSFYLSSLIWDEWKEIRIWIMIAQLFFLVPFSVGKKEALKVKLSPVKMQWKKALPSASSSSFLPSFTLYTGCS